MTSRAEIREQVRGYTVEQLDAVIADRGRAARDLERLIAACEGRSAERVDKYVAELDHIEDNVLPALREARDEARA